MTNPNPSPETRFQDGNTAALKHGGSRAVKALSSGAPLAGVAAELEGQIHAEIERDGLTAVMRTEIERCGAVMSLWYGLTLGAENVNDVERATHRYGWLFSKFWKAAVELQAVQGTEDSATLDTILAGSVNRE